jgi:hypothetical protein
VNRIEWRDILSDCDPAISVTPADDRTDREALVLRGADLISARVSALHPRYRNGARRRRKLAGELEAMTYWLELPFTIEMLDESIDAALKMWRNR